jgi:deoxyribonuclease-2
MNISALGDAGQSVDWWFLYKVPKLTASNGAGGAAGYEYLYYDSKAKKPQVSSNDLRQDKGALHFTLDNIFNSASATTGWLLYNDEQPSDAGGKDNGELGHTKGVIAFDTASKTAIWMLHSWPKYADPGAESMPTPMYGQTFLCLSLDIATVSRLASQMATYQQPQIYLPHLPASLDKSDPLYTLSLPLSQTVPGGTSALDCQTAGGLKFRVIAKNREWGKDFWNDLVGPTLGDDMDVETWIRGPIPPILDSDGVHKTFDIKFIDLRPLGATWAWPETRDHAKWGITKNTSQKSPWICVGDINRMISQEKRGGGTIAFQDAGLWSALKQTDNLVLPQQMNKKTALDLIHATHNKKATADQLKVHTDTAVKARPAVTGAKAKAAKHSR